MGEISTGKNIIKAGSEWKCCYGMGDLLLSINGSVRVSNGGPFVTLPSRALLLIMPAPELLFRAAPESNWEAWWIHFKPDGHLETLPNWAESPAPGIHLWRIKSPEQFKRLRHDFSELRTLDKERRKGWYLLFYRLLEVMILRGNMEAGENMGQEMLCACSLLKSGCSPAETARKCGMSRTTFYQRFRLTFGVSPHIYLEQFALRKSLGLLLATSNSIKEIAEECGFSSAFYFSTRFRKVYQVSPAHYRQRYYAMNNRGK